MGVVSFCQQRDDPLLADEAFTVSANCLVAVVIRAVCMR